MYHMGNFHSIQKKIRFEDIQNFLNYQQSDSYMINTMSSELQCCLIKSTLHADNEENVINTLLKKKHFKTEIIIYGKNYYDESVIKKYNQLTQLGFKNISVYFGGLFEWLCLQEIYGDILFPTTSKQLDLLKYK